MNQSDMTEEQKRLFREVERTDDSDCWIWQGQISNSGYGRVHELQLDRSLKIVSAQMASYRAFIGDVPEGSLVKQKCGNRLCINPKHLNLIQV